jgi:uncharacterized membrane protein YhaH (DUF805 family)
MQTPNPYQAPSSPSYSPSGPPAKMSVKDILFTFQGRIPRRTYWLWSILPVFVIALVMGLLMPFFMTPPAVEGGEPQMNPVGSILMLLLYIPLLWIGLAVGIKRWHDRGKSGWWILIGLIPFIGGVWTLVECGCLRGTMGPNPYGEDPT